MENPTGQWEDKDSEKPSLYKGYKLPKGTPLLQSSPVSFRLHSAFPINILLFSLPSTSSSEFFLVKVSEDWEIRP